MDIFNKIFFPHKLTATIEVSYRDPKETKILYFILIGFGAGILAGMFGIGGGLIISLLLIGVFKVTPKKAVAMALASMFLPVAIGGVILNQIEGNIT